MLHNPELRDGLRAYARLRDEDSPDTHGMIQRPGNPEDTIGVIH